MHSGTSCLCCAVAADSILTMVACHFPVCDARGGVIGWRSHVSCAQGDGTKHEPHLRDSGRERSRQPSCASFPQALQGVFNTWCCMHNACMFLPHPTTHQDGIWGVRKACAESLVAFSSALPQALRAKHLVPVFERFANDQSKWVRLAAFHHLGPFLSTLESAAVSWHSCCCCC